MHPSRPTALLAGVFFLITEVASIAGLALYGPVLGNPSYIVSATGQDSQVLLGAFFEVVLVGIVAIVLIVALRQDASVAAGTSLLWVHDATFLLGPGFAIGLNSALLAYLMYRSQLVPRAIAVLGMAGGSLVFASSFAVLVGLYDQTSTGAMALALPVFAWEISFALWMIVKGFKTSPGATLDPSLTARLGLVPA